MQQETDHLKAIIVIQSWWKGHLSRNITRRLLKHLTKRHYAIKQLVSTQQNYIRDLSVVVSDFQGRLLKQGLLTQQQALILFANIDQIRQLNELFFATIFNQAEQYSHYKVIFDQLEKEIHFFKMYFEYFNNFPKSNSLLDTLNEKSQFSGFLDQLRTCPKYRQLTLKDYLIKPVQRLPKYVLLMKQIKKYTPNDHPDMPNIEKVLRTFEDVNNSNNEKLNQVLNRYKVSEIERTLLLSHSLSEPGVEFVLEEPVSLLTMDGQVIEGTLYLLNTELIVAKREGQKRDRVLSNVPFKHGGQIMYNQEHYYYKNSFTVQNGEGDSCTLVFDSEEEKETLLQKIFDQLMRAQQKNIQKLASLCHIRETASVDFLKKMNRLDLLPEVEVLGTEERSDSMFKYTIYIIEVKIKSIRQKLFLRFRELLQLQDLALGQGLNIKNILVKTTWLTNHNPRKIEQRKMNIQRFLKELLSKEEVVNDGEQILETLGLPPSFYKLPTHFRQAQDVMKRSEISQRSTNSQQEHQHPPTLMRRSRMAQSLIKSKRTSIFHSIAELMGSGTQPRPRSRQISIQDILQANELNLGHFTRISQNYFRCSGGQKKLQFDILIPWIQNEKGFVKQRVQISCTQKVYSLIERLADQINLKYFKDFRIYLERQYANRLLDDDQMLSKVAVQVKQGSYLMILKKMIYLTPEIEEREIRADRVRLQLVASQAIYDCKKDKFLLSYSQILQLSALVGLSQLFYKISPSLLPEELNHNVIKQRQLASKTRDMVVNKFASFYDSPQTWHIDYQKVISHLFSKIKGICQNNSQVFRLSGIKDQEKEYNTTNMGQLAAVTIINEIKENEFYGSLSFIVQISEWFRHILEVMLEQEENKLQNRNCWLIIKHDVLHLYSISLKQRLFSFDYEDILRMVAHPAAIEINLRGRQVDMLKLMTPHSYSIRELILYYKKYHQMIRRMDEDEYFEQSILELVQEPEIQ